MISVPFTEYRRPHGSKHEGSIMLPDDVAERAQVCIDNGGRFAIENCGALGISLTFEFEGDDLDIEVVKNGPGLISAGATRLIDRVHAHFCGAEGRS